MNIVHPLSKKSKWQQCISARSQNTHTKIFQLKNLSLGVKSEDPKNIEGHGKILENFNSKSVTNICNLWQSGKFFGGGCKMTPKNGPLLIDHILKGPFSDCVSLSMHKS